MIAIPPTSTAIPLNQAPLSGLAAKIGIGAPLMLQGEGASGPTIFYRWGQQSGIVSETAFSTATATANQVCGAKLPGQQPIVGELVPVNTTHLICKVPAGVPTAFLRIWAP